MWTEIFAFLKLIFQLWGGSIIEHLHCSMRLSSIPNTIPHLSVILMALSKVCHSPATPTTTGWVPKPIVLNVRSIWLLKSLPTDGMDWLSRWCRLPPSPLHVHPSQGCVVNQRPSLNRDSLFFSKGYMSTSPFAWIFKQALKGKCVSWVSPTTKVCSPSLQHVQQQRGRERKKRNYDYPHSR